MTKKRFKFGKIWESFLKNFSEERLKEAKHSLCTSLDCSSLKDLTFLDIGSGSGLFSLAAYQLGAKVTSFDYDADSVACTKFLKEQFAKNDDKWQVFQGSVLDQSLMVSR